MTDQWVEHDPDLEDLDEDEPTRAACGAHIDQVCGDNGPTWVHSTLEDDE